MLAVLVLLGGVGAAYAPMPTFAVAAMRNIGILLLFPLPGEWSERHREYGWRVAYLAFVPTGLVAYMTYLWWHFRDPSLFYSEEAKWGREASGLSGLPDAFWFTYENISTVFNFLALSNSANYQPLSFQRLIYALNLTHHLYSLLFFLFALVVLVADGDGCRVISGPTLSRWSPYHSSSG